MKTHAPTAFSIAVAECFACAHHIYLEVLPVHSHGPVDFSSAAPDSIAWAHPILPGGAADDTAWAHHIYQ